MKKETSRDLLPFIQYLLTFKSPTLRVTGLSEAAARVREWLGVGLR